LTKAITAASISLSLLAALSYYTREITGFATALGLPVASASTFAIFSFIGGINCRRGMCAERRRSVL